MTFLHQDERRRCSWCQLWAPYHQSGCPLQRKRYVVTAKAATHRGQRRFVVEASTLLDASREARRQAPAAGQISVREVAT